MMLSSRTKARTRAQRRRRIRARVRGTATRPRLAVFRSLRHLSAQLVDDEAARTLLAVTDRHLAPTASAKDQTLGVARAFALGRLLAERAGAKRISAVVFDRAGYAYHGRVKALAEGARAGGLRF